MVGSNHTDKDRTDPQQDHDHDPIAELSEIMKFDLSGAPSPRDEMGIDLENELLGEFASAFPVRDEPVQGQMPEEEGLGEDFAEAMREAFPEEQPQEPEQADVSGFMDVAAVEAKEDAAPMSPADLENQLQALLAELDGSGDAHAEGEAASASFSPTGPVEDWQFEEEPAVNHDGQEAVREEAEIQEALAVPEPSPMVDPEAEFNDELSKVIAGLEADSRPDTAYHPLEVQPQLPDPVDEPHAGFHAQPGSGAALADRRHEEPLMEVETSSPAPAEWESSSLDDSYGWSEDVPEIETAELPDDIEPVADDLDIPHVEYAPEPAPQHADIYDLGDDFSNAFDALDEFDRNLGEKVPPASIAAADVHTSHSSGQPAGDWTGGNAQEEWTGEEDWNGQDWHRQPGADLEASASDPFDSWREPAAAAAAGAAAGMQPSRLSPVSAGERHAADQDFDFGGDGRDGDGPIEDDDDFYIPRDEVEEPDNRRKFAVMVAAAVATVAIAGGIGWLAFSGDGGGDGPAIVQADQDPMKVKPENPGGAQAPNEDKAVYDRVAGAGEADTPSQQTLIATEEEPIDIEEAVSQPRVVLPGTADDPIPPVADAGDESAPAAGQMAAKSEDRILPEEQDERANAAEEFVTVEPRRVRTLIVKPDGTLVPREEDVAPAIAEGLRTGTGNDALVASAEPMQQNPVASDASPVQAERMEAPASAPAQQAAPQQQPAQAASEIASPASQSEASTPAQQQPAQQQQTQVASAPANGGNVEYWVQVSSQPSRELAQASYTDLARRHGDLVTGRAVNIFPAEIEGRGTFYRVRVAGGSREEANALCGRLKSAGASCFVTR